MKDSLGWIELMMFLAISISIGAGVGINQFKIEKEKYYKELQEQIAELQKANDSFSMSESIAIAEINNLENKIAEKDKEMRLLDEIHKNQLFNQLTIAYTEGLSQCR